LSWAFNTKRWQATRTPKNFWSAQACLRFVLALETKRWQATRTPKNYLECAGLACALSWALETKRWQATRTPKNYLECARLACALSWALETKRWQATRTPKNFWSAQACLRFVLGFRNKAVASHPHSKFFSRKNLLSALEYNAWSFWRNKSCSR